MNEIVIGNTNVSIKEYQGNRVITFKDIDAVHGRPEGTARRNFNRNKEHFIEGEDYFVRNSYEAKKEYNATAPNGLILLTESGYLMLAKSFTDKLAWDVQRALVKSYFRATQDKAPQYEQIKLEEKPYNYVDKFYKGQPVLTSTDIEFLYGISHSRVDHALHRLCIEQTDYKYLTHSEIGEFKKENPSIARNLSHTFVIFKSGFEKLVQHFGIKVEMPKIMLEHEHEKVPKVAGESFCRVMNYIRREIKGIESLTYLLESCLDEDEFMILRNVLLRKLKGVGWWKFDAQVKPNLHKPKVTEYDAIFCGERGMRNI